MTRFSRSRLAIAALNEVFASRWGTAEETRQAATAALATSFAGLASRCRRRLSLGIALGLRLGGGAGLEGKAARSHDQNANRGHNKRISIPHVINLRGY